MRKEGALALLIFTASLHLLAPITMGGLTSWDVDTSWGFRSGNATHSGSVLFSDNFTATSIQLTGGLVQLTDFNMGSLWSSLGFSMDTPSSNMTVEAVSQNSIKYEANAAPGFSISQIDVGSRGEPDVISGVYNYSYAAGIVTAWHNHTSPVMVFLNWTIAHLTIFVTHSRTSDPLEDVSLTGWETGGPVTFTGLTNASGLWDQDVADNNYSLYIQEDQFYPLTIMFELSQDLNLDAVLVPLEEIPVDVPMLVLAMMCIFFTGVWWNTPRGEGDLPIGLLSTLVWIGLAFYWIFATTLTPIVALVLGVIGVYIALETFNATWEIWDL